MFLVLKLTFDLDLLVLAVPKRILREMKHGGKFPTSFCNDGQGSNATWLSPVVPMTVSSAPMSPSSKGMLFGFGKCKCLHTGHGNLDVNYKIGDTVLGITVREKDFWCSKKC